MNICPQCSREFEDKFKFCRYDGTALQGAVLGISCPKCGKEAKEGKRFCRHCGARLDGDHDTSDKVAGPPTVESQVTEAEPRVGGPPSAEGAATNATEKTQEKLQATPASCPQCGTEIEAGKKFCRHCGARLELTNDVTRKGIDKSESRSVGPPRIARPEATRRDNEIGGVPLERMSSKTILSEETLQEKAARPESPIGAAERYLKEKDYSGALFLLEPIVSNDPNNQEARLLHLLASIKLYNVYGYETQIESIKRLSNLSEKERGLAREIFLLRSDEASKRGHDNEAREYQRLASRVILGRSLADSDPQSKPPEAWMPLGEVEALPERKVQAIPETPRKITPTLQEQVAPPPPRRTGQKKWSRAVVITASVFLGVGGILGGGLLAYYAKGQGLNISSIYQKIFSGKNSTGQKEKPSDKADVAQVLPAEELGFKVWGAGATDINRRASLLSEKIASELDNVRESYVKQIQQKPSLMGSMTLQVTIASSGQVTKVDEFSSSLKDSEFKKTVVEEAYKWRFPEASSGSVKVNYPLLFLPPGMDVATLVKWEESVGRRMTALTEPLKSPLTGEGAEPADRLTKPASPPSKFAGSRTSPIPTLSPAPKFAETKVSPPAPLHSHAIQEPHTQQPPSATERAVIGLYEVLYPTSVYREPREDSQRVARVEAGIKVNVVGVQKDWLEVRSKHGNPPGFIKKNSAVPAGSR